MGQKSKTLISQCLNNEEIQTLNNNEYLILDYLLTKDSLFINNLKEPKKDGNNSRVVPIVRLSFESIFSMSKDGLIDKELQDLNFSYVNNAIDRNLDQDVDNCFISLLKLSKEISVFNFDDLKNELKYSSIILINPKITREFDPSVFNVFTNRLIDEDEIIIFPKSENFGAYFFGKDIEEINKKDKNLFNIKKYRFFSMVIYDVNLIKRFIKSKNIEFDLFLKIMSSC